MATDVGIRFGINGDREFRNSLTAINSQIRNLNTEMSSVIGAFTDMENSEEALAARADVLNRSMQAQQQKINLLTGQYDRARGKLEELDRALQEVTRLYGENSEEASRAQRAYNRQATEVNRLGSQLNTANNELRSMERQLRNTTEGVEDLAEEMDDADKSTSSFIDSLKGAFLGGAIMGAIQGLAGAISGLVDETLEFRKIVGTLETSGQKAGYTAEETAASFEQLYSVIGDEQQAATALANLQALGLKQEELTKLTDGAIGAWATYGDSIPIDGLAEAINETVKAGAVTGTFADVLNWAGTSEDDFNKALENTKTESERVNLVMQELARQGLMETAEAWKENNADILALQAANLKLKNTTAEYGKIATPIAAQVKEGLNGVLQSVLDIIKVFQSGGLEAGLEEIGNIGAQMAEKVKGYGAEALLGFSEGLRENTEIIIDAALGMMENLAKGIAAGMPKFIATAPEIIENFAGIINDNAPKVIETGIKTIGYLAEGILKSIPVIVASIPEIISAIISVWAAFNWANLGKTAITKLKDGMLNMLSALKTAGNNILKTILNQLKTLPTNLGTIAKNGVNGIINAINGLLGNVKSAAGKIASSIIDPIKNLPKQMLDFGKNIISNLLNGLTSAWNSLQSWVNNKISWLQNKLTFWNSTKTKMSRTAVDGSHANGLSYVPYNGYIAELHKGERVLTAGENKAYNKNSKNVQNTFHISAVVREEADIKRIAQELYKLQKDDSRGRGVVMV